MLQHLGATLKKKLHEDNINFFQSKKTILIKDIYFYYIYNFKFMGFVI